MKHRKTKYLILAATLFGLLFSCSNEKNTAIRRFYHNLTAYYNALYNARDALKMGLRKMEEESQDNYSQILPIFHYANPENASKLTGDMGRVLSKASKVIKKHSITAKPEKRRKNKPKEFYELPEYNKYVDDAYFLIGQGNFYRRDMYAAIEAFQYVVREYSMMPIKYSGQLWLAKSYIELKKYDKALDFIELLAADNNRPKKIDKEFYLTYADLYMRQYQYEDALEYLEKAIPLTKRKTEKYRYHFILAQLYQELGKNKEANENYAVVMRKNPNYEMVFNARINMAQLYRSTQGSAKELQSELMKMLKDEKNLEFQDQIYYALGAIEKNQGNEVGALEYFKKSAAVSQKNKFQKSRSFLAAAEIYFARPEYKEAQKYYDSTVSFLDKNYRDYNAIYKKSKNLTELVSYINIIERQDSLQRVARMDENTRLAFIDDLIRKVIEEEKAKKEKENMDRLAALQGRQTSTNYDKSGGWYFYNTTAVTMGETSFKQKWGTRKNEDHWRRSNKAISADNEGLAEAAEDSTRETDNKKREFYLQDLPLTDSAMHISDSLIKESYFNLANVYRIKLEDYLKAAETYEGLNKRFPDHEKIVRTYYNLYKIYGELQNKQQESYYRNLIINRYPQSMFARLMTDPEYIKGLIEKENQAKFFYQTTYRLFKKEKYDNVKANYAHADSTYKGHELMPKFALLNSLSKKPELDSVNFLKELEGYSKKYKGTDEQAYVDDIISYMKHGHEKPKGVEKKKEESIAEKKSDTVQIDFKFAEKEEHYYVTIVDTKKASANKIKFNLSNFNIDYYSILSFDVKDFVYSANYQIIVVKPFTTWFNAMNYYESVDYVKEVYEGVPKNYYVHFVISKSNYNKFFEKKAAGQYLEYFDENYIKRRENND